MTPRQDWVIQEGLVAIAVVVAWDGAHPDWLVQALASIDAQSTPPAARCLVVDSATATAARTGLDYDLDAHGWTVCEGAWLDPAAARNVGLAATDAQWVVFWDSDNVMAPGHLAATTRAVEHAAPNVGIVYCDIEYVDEQLSHGQRWQVPEWDYWALRASNYIDTSSAWRRMAIELAGGWAEGLGSFEDYALALEITRQGWVGTRRPGPAVIMRTHSASRSQTRTSTGKRRSDLWPIRSLGIVTLLAGRTSTYERWENFLRKAELPRHTGLYIVDNSADEEFGRRVQQSAHDLARARDLEHVTVLVRPQRYRAPADEGYFYRDRHLHVARLYAQVIPTVTEDLVLTLEDDVEPRPDAIRLLTEQMGCTPWGRYGAVAAAYDMADDALCAGRPDGGWGTRIHWSEVGDTPIDAGCVGGGCTLWANWALATHPISFRWHDGLGWDGSLCTDLRRSGYGVQVHGGVRAVHHIHGHVRS